VTVAGEINLDFADVEAIMRDAGPAWMSIGFGLGDNRAREAAQQAITNPLLDVSIEGSTGVLFNIVGGSDLKLSELHEAAEVIQRVVDPDANIIFGMTTDLKMENEVKLTIIATGFPTPDNIEDRESKMTDFLNEALSSGGEVELDLPPFLRRFSKRSNKPTEAASKNTDAEVETEVA
jgi:cell division protein FtsZ